MKHDFFTSRTESKISAAEMRVLHLTKGVTRKDRLRKNITAELGVKEILQYLESMQLKWYGKVKSMSDDRHYLVSC